MSTFFDALIRATEEDRLVWPMNGPARIVVDLCKGKAVELVLDDLGLFMRLEEPGRTMVDFGRVLTWKDEQYTRLREAVKANLSRKEERARQEKERKFQQTLSRLADALKDRPGLS